MSQIRENAGKILKFNTEEWCAKMAQQSVRLEMNL
jgi:hypothetical protein